MNTTIICLLLLLSYATHAQRFTEAEKKIITGGDTSRMLRVIPLSEPEGHKSLRAISQDIAFDEPLLSLLKERMYKAVRDPGNDGVGIAAPQVGINRNLIWVQRFDKEGTPFEFFINPKVVWRSELLRKGHEGDLSFSDKKGNVVRSYAILLSYMDMEGNQHLEMVEDFTAVIFQHEIDHLFGILLFDRMEEQRNKIYHPASKDNQVLLQEQ